MDEFNGLIWNFLNWWALSKTCLINFLLFPSMPIGLKVSVQKVHKKNNLTWWFFNILLTDLQLVCRGSQVFCFIFTRSKVWVNIFACKSKLFLVLKCLEAEICIYSETSASIFSRFEVFCKAYLKILDFKSLRIPSWG